MLGWTQQEIADKLKELFPAASGIPRDSVTNFLSENGNYHFPTKNELDKGFDIPTVAKRHELPEILVWRAALEGLSDQERNSRASIAWRLSKLGWAQEMIVKLLGVAQNTVSGIIENGIVSLHSVDRKRSVKLTSGI